MPSAFDVAVVGGGPAGGLVTTLLAKRGLRVAQLLRPPTDTRHVETLPGKTCKRLIELGFAAPLQNSALGWVESTRLRWNTEHVLVLPGSAKPSLLIDRGRFDASLSDPAAYPGPDAGAGRFLASGSWQIEENGPGWSFTDTREEAGRAPLYARYLVDARGRRSLNADSALGGAGPLVAVGTAWFDDAIEASEMLVEAIPDGWLWGIALKNGFRQVEAFLAPASAGSAQQVQDKDDRFRTALQHSETASRWFARALVVPMVLTVRDASPRFADTQVTRSRIRVGDASFTMDPIGSQGLSAAVRSAIQSSAVIRALLEGGDAEAAAEFYTRSQRAAFDAAQSAAAKLYAEQCVEFQTDFWAGRRSSLSRPTRAHLPVAVSLSKTYVLSDQCRVVPKPVLEEGRIVNRDVLVHPGLEAPARYAGDLPLAEFASQFRRPNTPADIIGYGGDGLSAETARRLLAWCLQRDLLVETSAS